MSILEDTAIFAAIVSEGGFSRAALKLGLSNGLISRRLAKLEAELGVTLLKRTTRQLQLTPEGELFWQHAKRIQQELDAALSVIQSLADKPRGTIRITAPVYFGKYYLMPILNQFMENFPDIKIELILTDLFLDPIKENIDLLIRGSGYFGKSLRDSTMKSKLLVKNKVKLYASRAYLIKNGIPAKPEDLQGHSIIGYFHRSKPVNEEVWTYRHKNEEGSVTLQSCFSSNDMDCRVATCIASNGIGKFSDLVYMKFAREDMLEEVLTDYEWGEINLYAAYSSQQALPKRTRLLLDFIVAQAQHMMDKTK